MKILLVAVNAKYIHSNLAVYYLKEYAKQYSNHIQLAEYTINHFPDEILKGIYKEQADVIAFSCYIWNIDLVIRVVNELRKVQPNAKIWFGGPEVSFDSEERLKQLKAVDGIILGEGEQTFLELMDYYIGRKGRLDQIAGIAFKASAEMQDGLGVEMNAQGENAITITGQRAPIPLDAIPFPYENMEAFRNKIIYYESSRGCPFSCSYCLSSIDKRVRLRSLDLVKRELGIFLANEVKQVKFVDRTFNCNKHHAMGIWQFIKEHDNQVTNFHFEISADLLDEEQLAFLQTLRPGQVQFEIGVQSTNPETVAAIHRKMDFEKISQNVRRIQQGHNIHQHLDLIAGLPLEDYETFLKSFNDVYALRPDQLQLGFLKVLKGSFMEEDSVRHKIVYQDHAPYEVLMTDRLTFGEILKLKGICEMVEVYYNSGQFTYSIRYLEHFFISAAHMYLELSSYYEHKGLDKLSHTRLRRYEILLDFFMETMVEWKDTGEKREYIAAFKEILLLDLYLRENMKSRPSYAHDPLDYSTSREIIDSNDLDKRQAHVELFTYDVLETSENGKPIKKDLLLVFDYRHRDPLNKAARLLLLDRE